MTDLPLSTANGLINYNDYVLGYTIDSWVQSAHKHNCMSNGWKVTPLHKGAFDYDNLACSINKVLQSTQTPLGLSVDEAADLIHQGWIENYIYWRDTMPWKNSTTYRKPASPLGDARRNKCADTPYVNLPQDEKDKDILIAKFVLEKLD